MVSWGPGCECKLHEINGLVFEVQSWVRTMNLDVGHQSGRIVNIPTPRVSNESARALGSLELRARKRATATGQHDWRYLAYMTFNVYTLLSIPSLYRCVFARTSRIAHPAPDESARSRGRGPDSLRTSLPPSRLPHLALWRQMGSRGAQPRRHHALALFQRPRRPPQPTGPRSKPARPPRPASVHCWTLRHTGPSQRSSTPSNPWP